MWVPGIDVNDPRARRVQRKYDEQLVNKSNVPATVLFTPVYADLSFVGSRHVPRLRLVGDVNSVQINYAKMSHDDGIAMQGLDGVTFDHKNPKRMTLDYDFNSEQIKTLVDKGLYLKGFRVPDSMLSYQWELPASTDIAFCEPESEDEPPILFMDLSILSHMTVDYTTTQYAPEQLFENFREKVAQQSAEMTDEEYTPERERGDLFAGVPEVEYSGHTLYRDRSSAEASRSKGLASEMESSQRIAELAQQVKDFMRDHSESLRESVATSDDDFENTFSAVLHRFDEAFALSGHSSTGASDRLVEDVDFDNVDWALLDETSQEGSSSASSGAEQEHTNDVPYSPSDEMTADQREDKREDYPDNPRFAEVEDTHDDDMDAREREDESYDVESDHDTIISDLDPDERRKMQQAKQRRADRARHARKITEAANENHKGDSAVERVINGPADEHGRTGKHRRVQKTTQKKDVEPDFDF